MSNLNKNIQHLHYLCDNSTFDLLKITEEEYNVTIHNINEWSKKKTLSHLVNMAVFQHQRIIRSQFEYSPEIIHDAENWLKYSNYEKLNSRKLILLWKNYNVFITDLIQTLDETNLKEKCFLGVEEAVSIEELFNDYILEVRSHLSKITCDVLEQVEEMCI